MSLLHVFCMLKSFLTIKVKNVQYNFNWELMITYRWWGICAHFIILADWQSHNKRCVAATEMNPNGPTRNVPKHNLALRQLHIITEDVLTVFTDKEKC